MIIKYNSKKLVNYDYQICEIKIKEEKFQKKIEEENENIQNEGGMEEQKESKSESEQEDNMKDFELKSQFEEIKDYKKKPKKKYRKK